MFISLINSYLAFYFLFLYDNIIIAIRYKYMLTFSSTTVAIVARTLLICNSFFFFQRRYVKPYRHILSQRFAKYAKVNNFNFSIYFTGYNV